MKFAKILLIISAIAFVASRTVTKEEEEYMAETKALKIETGYKELMELDDSVYEKYQQTNFKVSLQIGGAKAEGNLANTMFFTKPEIIFKSGIPFTFKTAPAAGVAKHLIKYSDNTYYIPFNTWTGRAFAEEHSTGKTYIPITLNNKHGYSDLSIVFTESNYNETAENYLGSMINAWSSARGNRKNHINTAFDTVKSAAFSAKQNIQKIKDIKDTDAQKKKKLEDQITEKKKEVQTLTNEVTEANTKFVKASGELATVETKLSNEKSKRAKLVIERNNLEANIKLLKGDVKPEEVLKKLKEKMDESLKQAEYWLKGSVYHRVVSEGEKSELMKIILDDAKFDERVAGYFSPQ
jgi:hypothetical protein